MAVRGRAKKEIAPGPVSRAVKLMQFFAAHGTSTISQVAAALKLPPSTVHRLLDSLAREGLIEHDKVERKYSIGHELFRISAQVLDRYDLNSLALPIIRDIVDRCNETCVLGLYLPSQYKMSFVAKVDSSRMLRYQIPMNTQLSVLWGATGRSILAFLPPEDVTRIIAEEASFGTAKPLPSRRELDRELAEIRERGFAITRGQRIPGAVGIGAPIFGANGAVVGSISVTAPPSSLSAADERKIGALVRESSAELSRRLGAPSGK